MAFSSLPFLFGFLPVFFLLYYLLPFRLKNFWLFVGSLGFYAYSCREMPWYFLYPCAGTLVTYLLGRWIRRGHRGWLTVGVLLHVGVLFYFKYAAFFAGMVGFTLEPKPLPLGLSFFTFQALAYLFDVYRGKIKGEKSLLVVGNLLTMFPHMASGPILDTDLTRRKLRNRTMSLAMVDNGLREFCLGLGMKVLLADQIGKLWSETAAIGYDSISTPLAWMALLAFTLQIFFDFYGYSRMAVGLGLMLGIPMPRNFDYPYLATSVTDFWRRWHITLGRWFRDYLYIPLGGSRGGAFKTVRNLLIVWLCTGLWHGAGWTFLLWGLLQFVLLVLEKSGLKKLLDAVPLLGHLYMMLVIPLSWLVFALPSLEQIKLYLSRLFPADGLWQGAFALDYVKYGKAYGWLLLAGLLFSTPLPRKLYRKIADSNWSALLLILIFWVCLYCLYQGANDPFLYFSF